MKGNGAFLIVLVILIILGLWILFMPNREPWQIGGGLAIFMIIAFFVLLKLK